MSRWIGFQVSFHILWNIPLPPSQGGDKSWCQQIYRLHSFFLFCFQTFQWIALGCQKGMEAHRDEGNEAHNQQRQDEYSDMGFSPFNELLQPMLHQPPNNGHGDEVGYSYLDEERTVQ